MAHRVFVDSLGRRWTVWTVVPEFAERRQTGPVETAPDASLDADRRQRHEYRVPLGDRWIHGWLAFESPGEKRRLAPFPDDWTDRTDEQLEDLCNEAVPVARPRRLVE